MGTGATQAPSGMGIELLWIPLGAGGNGFVRMNGRIYERFTARREHRIAAALYHTALQVRVSEGRYIVENAWPSPDADLASRGVVVVGPVWSHALARVRWFRYEVRCWRDGIIPDAAMAVGGAVIVTRELRTARRLLELVQSVPPLTWGREPRRAGDMWNSNSVVSWLLATAGVDMDAVSPPPGGRAPGWAAGIAVARGQADG